jgi:acetyl-CoA carboxylase biotin carboxyl carrier protein
VKKDMPAANGQSQQPAEPEPAIPGLTELAEVQKHAVELLAKLDRPPRNLRVQAGAVAVDITWPDEGQPPVAWLEDSSGNGMAAHPPRVAASGVAAVGVAAVGAAAAVLAADQGVAAEYLTSPGVGVFYHAREPGAEPFVSVGSHVQPGQQIGIIEAMKLMIPVEADRGGFITEVIKLNGEAVEYDERLFALAAEKPGSDV